MTPAAAPLLADVDVLVVGAGIVGLLHAVRAHDAGLRVLLVDRDHAAHGASVRNFGHVGSTLQSGELGVLARESREAWLSLGSRAGLGVQEAGTVVVAENDVELAVLEEIAATTDDDVRLLTPAQVEAATTVAGHRGALFPRDLRVDSRTAVPRLAAWLDEQPGVQVLWATSFLGDNGDGTIRTSRGDVRARRTVVAVGHDLDQVAPGLAAEREIGRCRLQMARVDAGLPLVLPAVLTATSMLRYSAFTATAAIEALATDTRERLVDLLGVDANLMMTQRPDGTLVVGDSHVTTPGAPPFLDERTQDVLLDAASALLRRPLRVVERWQGVYASSPKGPWVVRDIGPTTTAVSVTTGLGMTISPALAARTPL